MSSILNTFYMENKQAEARLEAPQVEIIIVRYWSAWVADSMLLMLPLFRTAVQLLMNEKLYFPSKSFREKKVIEKWKSSFARRQEWEQIVEPNIAHLILFSFLS